MRWTAAALALTLVACGGSVPSPSSTEHPLSAFTEIPYPPPAALAETVPPPPRKGVVWIDGEWVFHGHGYVWRRGGWVVPPPESRFAAWQTWYRRDGRLMMAPGSWYDAKQQRIRRPKAVEPATTPPNEITSEFQTGR